MGYKAFKAALFDLDGVVFDTEPQYSVFWGAQCRKYHPEEPGLENKIKGQTLVQIFEGHFSGHLAQYRHAIVEELNDYERQMTYQYIDGFESFVGDLRNHGVKTAVVTSSNMPKMENVFVQQPRFKELFDAILTSEDFDKSKPDPDCYLKAASRFMCRPEECVVFEDSFNGLRAGRAAQMTVVGLSTTNPEEAISALVDRVVHDYKSLNYEKMCEMIAQFHQK